MAIFDGVYCTVDNNSNLVPVKYAKQVKQYLDEKIPIICNALGHQIPVVPVIPAIKIYIEYLPVLVNDFQLVNPNQLQGRAPIQSHKDLGAYLHECIHWVQQPVQAIYNQKKRLFEGVADYYRIILSTDHMGDTGDKRKEKYNLTFDPNSYDSWEEYVGYLRHESHNANFVKDLNDVLKTNNLQTIDDFFTQIFTDTEENLFRNYQNNRTRILDGIIRRNRFIEYTT